MYRLFAALLIFTLSCTSAGRHEIVLSEDNTVSIDSKIDEHSVAKASQELAKKCDDLGEDLYLTLNSPGGSISAGRKFIDFVKSLPCKVHTISIFAASTAYQIVQNLDIRYALPSSTLMSHRAAIGGLSGKLPGNLITKLNFFIRGSQELDRIAAKRIGIPVEQYKKEIYNELWMSGSQALEKHHIDHIVPVRCDSSLFGTETREVRSLFGTAKITVSKCPLITGPLKIEKSGKRKAVRQTYMKMDIGYEF